MKTMKFVLAAMILSVAVISCQKDDIGPSAPAGDLKSNITNDPIAQPPVTTLVRYDVTVHWIIAQPLCGKYQVKVVNSAGVPVAPGQDYIPGINSYKFTEFTNQTTGTRKAVLVQVNIDSKGVCQYNLYTEDDTHFIRFKSGLTNYFDLYPSFNPVTPE